MHDAISWNKIKNQVKISHYYNEKDNVQMTNKQL